MSHICMQIKKTFYSFKKINDVFVSKFRLTILESLFWKFLRIKNLSLTLKEV
jgi:hypothetical protein